MTRLVLTRKLNETVVLHKDNKIIASLKITKIDRNQVRLTFTADKEINIDREEIFNIDNTH